MPSGESGEVLLRGAALMRAYYKDPEGTAAVLMATDGCIPETSPARTRTDIFS